MADAAAAVDSHLRNVVLLHRCCGYIEVLEVDGRGTVRRERAQHLVTLQHGEDMMTAVVINLVNRGMLW